MPRVLRRMERDAQFAQRKAERATVRSHFRDKYRLPKVRLCWNGATKGGKIQMELWGEGKGQGLPWLARV